MPDAVEVLLPAAPEVHLARVRGVVQFLRLISDDARSTRAGAVSVGIDRARSELDRQDRRRVEAALTDLLRHQTSALATPDTFFWWGEPGLDHASAWRVLDEFRDDLPWLAELPGPAEPADAVAKRLLECRERFVPGASDELPWKARVLRFTESVRAAEKLLRSVTGSSATSSGVDRVVQRTSIAVIAECLLDRGAVREARTLLQEKSSWVEGDPRLRQLLSWTLLCLGDYAGAKSAVVGLPPWSGTLPSSLIELRVHRPEWLPCLAGRTFPGRTNPYEAPRAQTPVRDRSDLGASVLGVFAFHPERGPEPLVLDAAPALRHRIGEWLRERDGSFTVAGQREHELVVAARPIVVHRESEHPLEGALGREGSMALALTPVLDAEGEVAGWLHVECEHHRVPSLAVLSERAAAWREAVIAHRGGDTERRRTACLETTESAWISAPGSFRSASARAFEDLVTELGIKTAQRRWWGFGLQNQRLHLLAMGGEGAGLSTESSGRGRALTRALATSGRVGFEEPDPRLSIDTKSGSGIVLPISAGGSLCGLLAIESSRRRDFRDADVVRFGDAAQHGGLAVRLAQFVDWHRDRFGFEVWFEADRFEFRSFASDFLAAARARSPVVLFGPSGSGKSILARWLHFESRTGEGPIRVVHCGSPSEGGRVSEWIRSTPGGTVILENVERLIAPEQDELLRILDGEDGAESGDPAAARVVATTRIGLKRAIEEGRLRDDLSHRLDRLQFRVPGLRDRREDVLPLTECLCRRVAREENAPVPSFSDEALALLWRQPWDGNVRELESFVYKLVLLGSGDLGRAVQPIEPPHILEIARRFSLQMVQRLPSRHPARGDLIAALRVTRKLGGRLNKTRAALYLGWDPDTLVARMQDAAIGEEIGDERTWTVPPAPAEQDAEQPPT